MLSPYNKDISYFQLLSILLQSFLSHSVFAYRWTKSAIHFSTKNFRLLTYGRLVVEKNKWFCVNVVKHPQLNVWAIKVKLCYIHFQYVYLSNAFQYHIIYFMEKVVHSCYKRETCLVQNASCMMSRELTDSRFFISVFCKCDNLCNI